MCAARAAAFCALVFVGTAVRLTGAQVEYALICSSSCSADGANKGQQCTTDADCAGDCVDGYCCTKVDVNTGCAELPAASGAIDAWRNLNTKR